MLDDQTMETNVRALAAAQVVAWLCMGAINVIVTWVALPMSTLGVRLALHLVDLGQLLAIGMLSAIIVLLWGRFGPARPWVGYAALTFVSMAVSQVVLRDDLRGAAWMLDLSPWEVWARIFAALFSLCIPAAAWVGRRLGTTRARWVGAGVAFAVGLGHQLILPNLYPGIHTYGTWFAATLLAGSIVEPLEPVVAAFMAQPRLRIATAVAGVVAAGALLVPAPVSVQTQISMLPGAVVARHKPSFAPNVAGLVPDDQVEWFQDRSTRPDIAPSGKRIAPDDAIVILLVVDAMRADMLSGSYAELLPRMTTLMGESVQFLKAYTPAPSTNAAIAALFAGRYPAQIKWVYKDLGRRPHLYPDDPGIRVGDVLSDKGVQSVVVTTPLMGGLRPEHGLTIGLRDMVKAPNGRSKSVVTAFLDWMESHHDGPLFAYLHVTDPHAPYNLGGKGGSAHERYAREVAQVDEALGSLFDGLRTQGLEDRVIMILTADHGEAFGEHNSRRHGTTVYEEMMRVPLLISGKNIAPRVVHQTVTLLDLAPTVLDLFDAPTPGAFMGQSLVPLLAGEDVSLTRPIFLDSHADCSGMVFGDDIKLVVRNGIPELYDLSTDPGELANAYETHEDAKDRFGVWRSFTQAHRMKFEKR